MTGNTSATGGFLLPTGAAPAEGQALENALQQIIVGVTGLPSPMVRPRWQPVPPTQPQATTEWCAFGISSREPEGTPYVVHNATGDGSDQMTRQEIIEVLLSFYGPGCQNFAAIFRDGIWMNQNEETMVANNMGLIDVGRLRAAPDLVNTQWINRCDIAFTLRRQVVRTYQVLNIEAAGITLTDDTGRTTPINAQ